MAVCPVCQTTGNCFSHSLDLNKKCNICSQLGTDTTYTDCWHSLCSKCDLYFERVATDVNHQFKCYVCREMKKLSHHPIYGTIECSICHDLKTDIKLIECGHCACTECFSKYIIHCEKS
jgi:hypothetical protein